MAPSLGPARLPSGQVRSQSSALLMLTVLRLQASGGACKGGGRRCRRVYKREAALTLNSSPGACVRVCVRACPRVCLPVSRGEGAGLEAAANHGPRGAEPSAPPSRGAQEL